MTAREEIEVITNSFGTSKPIFAGTFGANGKTHIIFNVKDRYNAVDHLDPNDDPIRALVAHNYYEDYENGKFKVRVRADTVYKDVVQAVKEFYLKTSELKNPKQSKLFKWLNDAKRREYNYSLGGGFLALYRYTHGKAYKKGDEQTLNVHAILELMMEKDERKSG
jgi:hypothetical protein